MSASVLPRTAVGPLGSSISASPAQGQSVRAAKQGAEPKQLSVWHFIADIGTALHGYLQNKKQSWKQWA